VPLKKAQSSPRRTLYHLYQKLGKSLVEWPNWQPFVTGFHPKLFVLAGIAQEDLIADLCCSVLFLKLSTKSGGNG
jgi:hypothetical protein